MKCENYQLLEGLKVDNILYCNEHRPMHLYINVWPVFNLKKNWQWKKVFTKINWQFMTNMISKNWLKNGLKKFPN